MILVSQLLSEVAVGFPRIRGGDPLLFQRVHVADNVFPASAGVIPMPPVPEFGGFRFPRIRGGDPSCMVD